MALALNIDDFNFDLPDKLIVDTPAEPGQSRLLVVKYASGQIEHTTFEKLHTFLPPKVQAIRNSTYVSPARVLLTRKTGARLETLFLGESDGIWTGLMRKVRRLNDNEELICPGSDIRFRFLGRAHDSATGSEVGYDLEPIDADGNRITIDGAFFEELGAMPLPPYMHRAATSDDKKRYQTVYANEKAKHSIAAPTAGLHFTPDYLAQLAEEGWQFIDTFLRIGYGTFAPISSENITAKKLHAEWIDLPKTAAHRLNSAFEKSTECLVIGTTSLRVLESCYEPNIGFTPKQGSTDIFIYPPYEFAFRYNLLTNFHLPKSSLFMLVCALGGTDILKEAYRQAVNDSYRFFSYGDAMLLLNE